MARIPASIQSGERPTGHRSNDLSTMTNRSSGSGVLLEAQAVYGGDGGPLLEAAAASAENARIIRQLTKELNEKEEKIQQLTETNGKLIETSACVSREARTEESELKKQIAELKLQNQSLRQRLCDQEHRSEVEKMKCSASGHSPFTNVSKRSEEKIATAAQAVMIGLVPPNRARSMSDQAVSHPNTEQDVVAAVGLNFVTKFNEEEEMEFSTAFDDGEDFEVIAVTEIGTRRRQAENKREATGKQLAVSQQTQTEKGLEDVADHRLQDLEEVVKRQAATISEREQENREKSKMLEKLRAVVSSLKSEKAASDQYQESEYIAALKIQVFENAEAFRKERNDRVMLNQRKEQLKRDCRVYMKERDEARRQAEDAIHEQNRLTEEMMKIKEQLQRLQYGSPGRIGTLSSSSNTALRNLSSTITNRGHYHFQTRHSASSGRRFPLSENDQSTEQRYSSVFTESQARSVAPEEGASSALKGNTELNASHRHVSQGRPPSKVDVVSVSESKSSRGRVKDEDVSLNSLDRFACYHRCGAVQQSADRKSEDSSSTTSYLQCDHINDTDLKAPVTVRTTTEETVRMSCSFSIQ